MDEKLPLPPSLGGKMKNFYLIIEFKPSLYLIPPKCQLDHITFSPIPSTFLSTKFSLNGTLSEKTWGNMREGE